MITYSAWGSKSSLQNYNLFVHSGAPGPHWDSMLSLLAQYPQMRRFRSWTVKNTTECGRATIANSRWKAWKQAPAGDVATSYQNQKPLQKSTLESDHFLFFLVSDHFHFMQLVYLLTLDCIKAVRKLAVDYCITVLSKNVHIQLHIQFPVLPPPGPHFAAVCRSGRTQPQGVWWANVRV